MEIRSGPVLTIVAMAQLAGRREIAEIARFATTLSQKQRHLLGLPRKKTTRAFYEVPTYSVFYALLTRLDAEAFAAHLHAWLQTHADALPQALALDGKLIRDQIGLLTLAQHEDGAPQAVAICDQKEGTPRCEQTVADALHCLRPNARYRGKRRRVSAADRGQPAQIARASQGVGRIAQHPLFFEDACGHGRVERKRPREYR